MTNPFETAQKPELDRTKMLFGLAVGLTIIGFVSIISSIAPFRDSVLSLLYPKPSSDAATFNEPPTYQANATIQRTKPSQSGVWINDQPIVGVNIDTNWSHTIALQLGENRLLLSYRTSTGQELSAEELVIKRHGEGDINGDAKVNVFDLGLLTGRYGQPAPPTSTDNNLRMSDINQNGTVDVFDLGILSGKYGTGYVYPTASTTPAATPTAATNVNGFGILGDSSSDEYRANDNRGGTYSNTTLNWMELLVKHRQLNFGEWGNRSEPRRNGFEYNFARSSATSFDLISTGQHTGMAQLVREGRVSHVYISIGANDFAWYNGNYARYYNGEFTGTSLEQRIQSIANNVITAVDVVKAAGSVNIIVTSFGDLAVVPEVQQQFPDATKRQQVTNTINSINSRIKSAMGERNVPVIDPNSFFFDFLLPKADSQGKITILNEKISVMAKGNEPHFGRLDDTAGHLGTVLSGMYANELFIKPMAQFFGVPIAPFSDQELLINAGIQPQGITIAPTPTRSVSSTPTTPPNATNTPVPTHTPTLAPTNLVTPTPTPASTGGSNQYAIRFYGNGTNDIDRIKHKIDGPSTSADVGNDFTIEFWLKASSSDNGTAACNGGPDAWINGNVIVDRDIYGPGDDGDYGISLMNGRIAFGTHSGSSGATACGNSSVADNTWHHIAVTRRSSDGRLQIYVDGSLNGQITGPTGNLAYADGRTTSYPNSDPYLVLGAEKHDAGASYPSYSGFMDEFRISSTLRYTQNFTRPTSTYSTDGQTVLWYRFEEGSGQAIIDSSGAGNAGTIKVGGSPSGPIWSTDKPF